MLALQTTVAVAGHEIKPRLHEMDLEHCGCQQQETTPHNSSLMRVIPDHSYYSQCSHMFVSGSSAPMMMLGICQAQLFNAAVASLSHSAVFVHVFWSATNSPAQRSTEKWTHVLHSCDLQGNAGDMV